MGTYRVLCARPAAGATNTVSVQMVDAETEAEAARVACARYGWARAKVRSAQATPPDGQPYTFALYDARGRRV